MLPLLLVCCLPQSPTPPAPLPLPLTVVGGAFREVAGAQAPLPEFAVHDAVRMTTLRHRGRTLLLQVAATDPPAELWLDADGDQQQDDGERVPLRFVDRFAEIDLKPFAIDAELALFQGPAGLRAIVRTRYHFVGELRDGDTAIGVRWVDMDADGAPSAGDRWIALPAERLAKLALPNSMFCARETNEPWHFGTRELRVQIAAAGEVAAIWSPLQQPRADFLAARHERIARWFAEHFATDRAEFEREHGIDPAQQRGTPVTWYHTSELADALAFAQRVQKPLLVEWSNDACPWCKRLPWSTYRDAAVIARLQDFACVRIDPDLEPSGAAAALGLEGVPNLTLLGPGGGLLDTLRGYSPPRRFATALDRLRAKVGLPTLAD